MMINLTEILRKTMGWCPNASTIRARKIAQFDGMVVNAPDSGGELTHTTARWLNIYRNKILVSSLILTLLAIYLFISYGKTKPDIFLTGMITGLAISLGAGVAEWRRLNKAAAGKFKNINIAGKKVFGGYIIGIGFGIVAMLVIMYFAINTGSHISEAYAFFSGLFLSVWLQYIEIIYWERKNQKILIMEKASFYAVDAKTMRGEQ